MRCWSDIERHACLQTRVDRRVAEAASASTLNSHHSRRVLEACDQIMALETPDAADCRATSPARLLYGQAPAHAGSGLHFHISLQNEHGENPLTGAPGELSDNMQQAMAACWR
ncbi:hypothetical protein M8494_25120 [Serratia ureilytica]